METNIVELVDLLGKQYVGTETLNAEKLQDIESTSFTWTRTPKSLCLAANKQYLVQALQNENVYCIVTLPSLITDIASDKSFIITANAAEFFYTLHNAGVHRFKGRADSFVKSRVGANCNIADTAVISNSVSIGDNVSIGYGTYIGENTIIEGGVEIGPNCVIGVDGLFGKKIQGKNTHIKHFGGVKIGQDCKIHASVTVARSVNHSEFTTVNRAVHLGHRSNVGHDVTIGRDSTLSVGAVVCGRVIVGENCWIGAGAIVSNMCKIGDGAQVRIGSIVVKDVLADSDVSGNFAVDHRCNLRKYLRKNR
ncbi:DapH/DapD/GlmU-related protein [Desulfopila sp. IMCC35008]|uniref:DapH/DapD/GlmU-related protein n=1 Tax=Desulfopila sp. IMCC35008 TaxID=2653858 RepID=UPI0013D2ED07|nr:DapH/DapD/GlmU-related protein [Desulfopila sp. IMCC35008]